MTHEITFSDARAQLTDVTNDVAFRGDRVVITRNGKQHVAIVPIDDLEMIEALEDKMDLKDAKNALADTKKRGTVSWKDVKRNLGL
ncbi:MAG: type II toxin-antitoxin system Phd/YefM family antitoxin [Simkaniaceae bacterium]|nr:type II toxin-antitoxin system Phd/YefM family antitoxin [Simkaniaceae bacterium]